ncbi:hypothetical protein [Haoranjiania flava]
MQKNPVVQESPYPRWQKCNWHSNQYGQNRCNKYAVRDCASKVVSKRDSFRSHQKKNASNKFESTSSRHQIMYKVNLAFKIFVLDVGSESKSFAVPSEYSRPNIQPATIALRNVNVYTHFPKSLFTNSNACS